RRSEEGEAGREKDESEKTGERQDDEKALKEAIGEQLEELGARIDILKANLLESKSDLKTKYEDQMADLKVKAEEMQKKVGHLKETGGDAWEELKVGLSELWNSFDRALSKFREKKEDAVENLAEKKTSYERRIEAELHEWGTKIDILKAKAEASKAEARSIYVNQIEGLKAKQEAAKRKLNQLRESGEEAWEDVKKGVDTALTDLGKAIKDALSKFQ
ncbi:MAG: hypothetical protein MIO92_09465, partial [Methanosarcinaceae archaeon]|nr:hypothetical protein [Methanosarcinaceae archaeon]